MKCRMCNGTGKTEGYFYESTEMKGIYKQVNVTIKCNNCNGTGEIEQTNEEWLSTLDTVEKSIVLSKVAETHKGSCFGWEYWLKEKHNEI